MTKIRAVIYARVSTEEQVREGFSIAAQLAELEKYAEQFNFDIIDRYVDEGASGKSIKGRTQLQRLLKDAEKQKFQVVMLYKLDRLARKLRDQLDISDKLVNYNIKLVSLKESFDTSTPTGMMTFQMFGMIAELERSNIIERGKLGQQQRAREGKFNGGVVLGYNSINKELVVNESESIIVKKIFDYADEGQGLKAITRRLNEAGYRSKKGNPFSTNAIKTILNNPTYIGKIRYNQVENWSEKRRKGKNDDFILTNGIHEPIITKEQWDRVHSKIKKRSYKPARSYTPYLLSGILKCPVCGHGMVPARSKGNSGSQYRYYACGQFHNKGKSICRSNMIKAEYAEQQVMDELHRIIAKPYILKKLVERINQQRANAELPLLDEKKAIENQIAKVQRKLKSLKEKIMIDPELAELFKPDLLATQSELNSLQERLDDITSQEAQYDNKPVDFDSLHTLLTKVQDALQHADREEQKLLLQLLIQSIHISKDKPSRRESRRIERIILHFDFAIESLHSDTTELVRRIASYSELITPIHPVALDEMNNLSESNYGDLMKSLNILPLAMVRFPPHNLKSAVDLLHQDEAYELVRVG
ncbi:recombinase family protein [Paenibacillus sp. SAFN-117]|uniref:recombinase family protein n=1 Tax=Paenibacillus sp. SAFN-117 TaxID=3436860 RepID=UPI003F814320